MSEQEQPVDWVELYQDLKCIYGLDPVPEMFRLVANHYKLPQNFIDDVLARTGDYTNPVLKG